VPESIAPRLAVLKALGDNTRYAIYLELARSPRPLATAEIAETLDLHPNTVRPHLERMRDVGLLAVEAEARGAVGRPQHRYYLSPDAPSLGLEPATFPLLAGMLLQIAGSAGLGAEEAAEAGRDQGAADAVEALEALAAAAEARAAAPGSRGGAPATADATGPAGPTADEGSACVQALVARLDALGFDPAIADDDGAATVAFTHCPFRALAEANPDLVCGLHRGLVEGFVATHGGARVEAFHTLLDRTPCQVELVVSP
jgi:predicted ArsR family transcriptional regulator